MTGKQAIDTISRSPWLLAAPVVTACILAIYLVVTGEVSGAAIVSHLIASGVGVVGGGAVRREKTIAAARASVSLTDLPPTKSGESEL